LTEVHHCTSQQSSQTCPTSTKDGGLGSPNSGSKRVYSGRWLSIWILCGSLDFVQLPRELRDYIYEYTFSGPRYNVYRHGGISEPARPSTCKIIRDEAIPLFYGDEMRLRLIVNSHDPVVLELCDMKFVQLARVYAFRPAKVDAVFFGSSRRYGLTDTSLADKTNGSI
jgi:hypothetical protein